MSTLEKLLRRLERATLQATKAYKTYTHALHRAEAARDTYLAAKEAGRVRQPLGKG